MERVPKSKPKLIDLFNMYQEARIELETAKHQMSVTPTMIRNEMSAFEVFYERLKECKC